MVRACGDVATPGTFAAAVPADSAAPRGGRGQFAMTGAETADPSTGQVVRQVRRRLGLTQQDLASRTGVSVRTIRDLEADRVQRPHRATMDRIAGLLPHREDDPPVHLSVLGPLRLSRGDVELPVAGMIARGVLGLLALN